MSPANENRVGFDRVRKVDRHVGQRLSLGRKLKNFTEAELAERLGIRQDQLAKYELGTLRLPAGQLYEISNALELPVAWFFEGLGAGETSSVPPTTRRDAEVVELVQIFEKITNADRRATALSKLKEISSATSCDDKAG